jgi:hypothetical protein
MEEVQLLDYKEHDITRKKLKLNDTLNPLLHLFRELRNMEVHLQHSEFRETKKNVLWGHIDRPTEATPLTISNWTLDGVTSQSFSQLRNASKYTPDQIDQMVSWLNTTQEEWGVQELFCLAVDEYCRLLKL